MKKILAFSFLSLSLFTGCNNDDDDISDYDIVKTEYSRDYWETENPTTYYLVNNVRWIETDGGEGNSNPDLTRNYDQTILNSIDENMAELGYTKVTQLDEENLPDLIIAAQALATTYADIDFIWDGWYDWWGYYDPYYPGGYYPVYYEWIEGTLFIEMASTSSIDVENEQIDIVWGAGINGLVRGSQSANIDFIEDRVEDAFEQSESYLTVQ
ncbi:DUF4136 domain-containing protein [Joostella sp. CR20]|uniref:DUF4136 domain-containing protein n=1 Tax=Joostella sp. CR20 TaxID=2804312 RepID=UPI00313DB51F